MNTVRLTIEFDGTNYIGWQWQPNGESLQKIVEEAVARVVGTPIRLHSSGRTDAGVHARGMVAHFQVEKLLPLAAYREGVNHFLPDDIAIIKAEEAPAGFHARFSATGKWYRYTIWQGEVRSPLLSGRYWHVRSSELDVALMRRALADLVGRHDFAAFRSSGCDAVTTEREIVGVEIVEAHGVLHVDIAGNGFLRNMIRIIVGTIVEIGLGKRSVKTMQELLDSGHREQSGVTAPAAGLCLMQVWYERSLDELRECFISRENA